MKHKKQTTMKTNFIKTALFFLVASTTVIAQQPTRTMTAIAVKSNPKCFNEATGSISVNVDGGLAPYTYVWSVPGNTSEVSGLEAGVYDVTVFDANDNQVTLSIELQDPKEMTLKGIVTNVSAVGASDGAIDVEVMGLEGNFNAFWTSTDGAGYDMWQFDQTNITVGTYKFEVTSDAGCTISKVFVVHDPSFIETPLSDSLVSVDPGVAAVMIYPNPSNGIVHFKTTGEITKVAIYNSLGMLVHEADTTIENGNIPSLNLEHGNYNAIFEKNDGTVERQRMVIR